MSWIDCWTGVFAASKCQRPGCRHPRRWSRSRSSSPSPGAHDRPVLVHPRPGRFGCSTGPSGLVAGPGALRGPAARGLVELAHRRPLAPPTPAHLLCRRCRPRRRSSTSGCRRARRPPGRTPGQGLDRGVFVDTSSYGPQAVDALVRVLGIDAIVLGSDRPYADPAALGLGAAADRAITHQPDPAACRRYRMSAQTHPRDPSSAAAPPRSSRSRPSRTATWTSTSCSSWPSPSPGPGPLGTRHLQRRRPPALHLAASRPPCRCLAAVLDAAQRHRLARPRHLVRRDRRHPGRGDRAQPGRSLRSCAPRSRPARRTASGRTTSTG